MHGAVLLDDGRRGPAAGDHLVRPAHRGRSAGGWTTHVGRARLLELTSNPGAHEFHADETAVGAHARTGRLEPRAPRAAAEGLRPLSAERRARDRRRRRVRHADARRRRAPLVAGDDGRRRASIRRLLPRCSSRREVCARVSDAGAARDGLRAGTPIVAGAGDQAAGAVGMGITRPGTVSATHRHVGRGLCRDRPARSSIRGGRLHTFCHAIPGSLARHGCHAGGGPVAAVAPRSVRAHGGGDRGYDELVDGSVARAAGGRRRAVGALSDGRAHSSPRPERPRRARRPCRQPHPRTRRPRGARRRGVQPARFVHDLFRAAPPGREDSAGRRRRAVGGCGARSRPTFTARMSKPSRPKKAPVTALRFWRASAQDSGTRSTRRATPSSEQPRSHLRVPKWFGS